MDKKNLILRYLPTGLIPGVLIPVVLISGILISGIMYGCIGGTSPKSVYYLFNASSKLLPLQSLNADQGIVIGPVKIPEYLKCPQIVTRKGENSLYINEFHRWGDSLDVQITNVLVENLSTLFSTLNIATYPWKKPFTPKYQIYIDFRRFDGKTAESVVLNLVWKIVDVNENRVLLTRRFSLIEPTKYNGVQPYVTAMNEAMEKLSQEIADGVLYILDD